MNKSKNNQILSALPSQVYQRLNNHFELIQLSLGQVLLEANQKSNWVYFPLQGIVSLVSVMQDGSTTEVGLIGNEGMVGTPQFLGKGICNNRAEVQLKGEAVQVSVETLQQECDRSPSLERILQSYNLKLFNQAAQCAACNNHHSVKQRTARWLVMLDDRVDDGTLKMTQQLLSQMLGVRRSGVSQVAFQMQQQGIIDYKRGNITILDRKALETVACECYQFLKI